MYELKILHQYEVQTKSISSFKIIQWRQYDVTISCLRGIMVIASLRTLLLLRMHVTKAEKLAVYKMLFNGMCVSCYVFCLEGVFVAKKDKHCNHHILKNVDNLHVHLLMKSFVSRAFVRETYNWGYSYWFLTEAGIILVPSLYFIYLILSVFFSLFLYFFISFFLFPIFSFSFIFFISLFLYFFISFSHFVPFFFHPLCFF